MSRHLERRLLNRSRQERDSGRPPRGREPKPAPKIEPPLIEPTTCTWPRTPCYRPPVGRDDRGAMWAYCSGHHKLVEERAAELRAGAEDNTAVVAARAARKRGYEQQEARGERDLDVMLATVRRSRAAA